VAGEPNELEREKELTPIWPQLSLDMQIGEIYHLIPLLYNL